MEDSNQRNYYTGRASIERECAEKAADPASRRVHTELADRYEFLAGEASPSAHQPENPTPQWLLNSVWPAEATSGSAGDGHRPATSQ